jgi:hypothetical protein
MRQLAAAFAMVALTLGVAVPAQAVEPPCELEPRTACFGLQSVDASLSTTLAGAHPDLTFSFEMKQDPETKPNSSGFRDSYATPRDIRFELPPGLVGDPNVLGLPQQCTVDELATFQEDDGGCPNGSQVGLSAVSVYGATVSGTFHEPVYMMQPPGGDVVARLGFIAGIYPVFVELKVRSEDDYGLVAEISDAPTAARLVRAETTTWGVPADSSHDTERCTPAEVLSAGCTKSPERPPGSRPLPFLTNPTRCGVSLEMRVSASSWSEPDLFDTASASFPPISGCDKLPFGPDLTAEPTRHSPSAPTGLDMTLRLPGPDGVNVLEPSQMRDIEIELPQGLVVNPGAADGLGTCSVDAVNFGTREPSECPDAAKVATTEFEVPALPRRMKGAVYLREPEPGNLFRVWIVADDLGAHVKLPGQLEVDRVTGQITTVVLDLPQVPLRETKVVLKSGFRAPLATPPSCGTYITRSTFIPWSATPPVSSSSPMTIDQGCSGIGGFSPDLSAGTTDPSAGSHSPFVFTLIREDGEQSTERLDISLPPGLSAKLAGVPLCEGAAAATGDCPTASQIGKVIAASGYGPAPLWVPQPGKRPTAVYLGGPYRGAPLSVVTVVPAQAGPFDLGNIVVRSSIHVDPETAQATIKSDAIPQIIEGIPIPARTIHVNLDRPGFTLNPTGCKEKSIAAAVTSSRGAVANPSSPFRAANCASLGFKPKLSFQLFGGTRRGAHPKLRVVLATRSGDANLAKAAVTLPRSEFLDQAHIKTVCTRVQYAADQCPPAAIYGHAKAISPLLDKPLEGPVYLRSSSNLLPDLVVALHGQIDIDVPLRVDSVRGGIRTTSIAIPDAPVSKFILEMQAGKKGLLINSRNLCKAPAFADVDLDGQNGKSADQNPRVKTSCGSKARRP